MSNESFKPQEFITITMEEYKELLMIKGKYEESIRPKTTFSNNDNWNDSYTLSKLPITNYEGKHYLKG